MLEALRERAPATGDAGALRRAQEYAVRAMHSVKPAHQPRVDTFSSAQRMNRAPPEFVRGDTHFS